MPPTARLPRYPQLDGLRAVAILLVLAGHIHSLPWLHEHFGAAAPLGVNLFFVLSGFLITGLLCHEEARNGRIDLLHFYVNRALRIFPAFYVFLGVIALLVAAGAMSGVPWYTLAVCALYLRNIFGTDLGPVTHIWTLSLEEQFYAIWPWVVWRVRTDRLLRWSLAGVAAITAWRTVAIVWHLWSYEAGRFYVRPDFRFDSILEGSVIALFLFSHAGASVPTARRAAALLNPIWLLPVTIAWSCAAQDEYWARPIFITLQTALAAAILFHLVVVGDGGRVGRALSHPALGFVGRISYSMYLWQQIFLDVPNPRWGIVQRFPFDLIATFAAALASHYLVEKPFLRWKERLRERHFDRRTVKATG